MLSLASPLPWVTTVTTSAAASSTKTAAAVVTTVRRFALNTAVPYRLLQGVVLGLLCPIRVGDLLAGRHRVGNAGELVSVEGQAGDGAERALAAARVVPQPAVLG